jgi:hypothetical protein
MGNFKVAATNRTLMQSLNLGYRVAPAIDNWLDNNPEKEWGFHFEPKIPDDAWHPSGDCTPSVYDLWLKATGAAVRKPLSVGLKKTFGVGHYYHQWIQWILRDELQWCKPEDVERRGGSWWGEREFLEHADYDNPTPAPENAWGLWPGKMCDDRLEGYFKPSPFHWSTGSADIAPLVLPDATNLLFDIKSISGSDAKFDTPPARYVDKWECQACIYLDWFPECEEAIFFGVSKENPHGFKEWVFKPNPPLVEAIYEKWQLVTFLIDEGITPDEEDADLWIDLPLQGIVCAS